MRAFAGYVKHLRALLEPSSPPSLSDITPALDGQPSLVLRRVVPLKRLRSHGAFFSGSALSRRLLATFSPTLTSTSVLADPACGAGDLLVAAADHLPVAETLSETLAQWGGQLVGRDIHPEFVAATVARLALSAVRRGVRLDADSLTATQLLDDIQVGSSLTSSDTFNRASHIVMNPPFASTQAPRGSQWAEGQVNSAAVFLEHALLHAKPGTEVAAILPDVLRSGSRYAKWRRRIESLVAVERLDVVGRFASDVDIDVFVLVGKTTGAQHISSERTGQWASAVPTSIVVGDLFDVLVGTLVPHRDPERGPWYPVVAARSLPRWTTVRSVEARRRFSGSVVRGPFVAVRRTSRPGDGARALATIIAIDRAVVVENHIIVLRPRDRLLRTCGRLLASLQRPETTAWLDHRIRCHHLTVTAVRDLPIWT